MGLEALYETARAIVAGNRGILAVDESTGTITRRFDEWPLSFSFGQALQASTLQAWQGRAANVESAQAAFLHRARCNAAAVGGSYDARFEALRTV